MVYIESKKEQVLILVINDRPERNLKHCVVYSNYLLGILKLIKVRTKIISKGLEWFENIVLVSSY